MIKRFAASALVLVFCIAAFAGSAFAGNGNGQDKEKADTGSSAASAVVSEGSAPANSANAPGQMKKEAVSSEVAETVSAVQDAAAQGAGVQAGVKPSSETAHDTYAASSSKETKQYGNGKTAGQIAMQNGAGPTTMLHGPGNSQPHKAALCSGGHEVDVHALKSKRNRKGCGASSLPPGPNPNPNPGPRPNTNPGSTPNVSTSNTPGPSSNTGGSSTSTPGSKGSTAKPNPKPSSGVQASEVLAAGEVFGPATLPFTGFPLWAAVVLAVILIALGLALRRRARAST
jgi:hypothetical protein